MPYDYVLIMTSYTKKTTSFFYLNPKGFYLFFPSLFSMNTYFKTVLNKLQMHVTCKVNDV